MISIYHCVKSFSLFYKEIEGVLQEVDSRRILISFEKSDFG